MSPALRPPHRPSCIRLLAACLVAVVTLSASAPAQEATAVTAPAPAVAPAATATQAKQLLETVSDPHKRAALTQTLQTLAKTAPAAAPPPKPALPLAPDSLGAELLLQLSTGAGNLTRQADAFGRTFANFPLAWRWLGGLAADPARRALLLATAWHVALALLAAGLAEALCIRLLRRPIGLIADRAPSGALDRHDAAEDEPELGEFAEQRHQGHLRLDRAWHGLARLPFVLLRLVLDLIPLGVFAAVAVGGTAFADQQVTRLVLLAVVNAYVICRLATTLARMIVSPDAPRLRLVRMTDAAAAYTVRWVRRLAAVAAFGIGITAICQLYDLPPPAQPALLKLIFLIDHLFLVVIVLQVRAPVAKRIHARAGRIGLLAQLQNRLAAVWHIIATFYIMALWVVWAAEVRDGYSKIWRLFLLTSAVLLGARLIGIVALGLLDRLFRVSPELADRYPGIERRANHTYGLVRRGLSALLFILAGLVLLEAWGVHALGWLQRSRLGAHIVSASFTIAVAALLAVALWEAMNVGFDRQQAQLARDGQLVRLARIRTLLPIIRTALFVALLIIFGLTALSEIGVNIAPLLAGAGILGVAIGFGSQKLVQDFITGIFLLLENAMQVGDTVTLAGLSGVVETLSIRTIRLRAGDGSVHIIPFSSVSTVTNSNRGQGNAAVSVTIAADQDSDAAADALVDIARDLRSEPAYAAMILNDFALWGVDRVEGQGLTIVGQIPCTDSGRWGVQREFNRRLFRRFAELGIRLAVPVQQTLPPSLPSPPGRTLALARRGANEDAPAEETLIASPPPSALGHTQ